VVLTPPFDDGRPDRSAGQGPAGAERGGSAARCHFGLYVYGKQIVDGLKPFWDGVDPYQIGNIPEWTAARQQAVDEAVPKIIERLRPKYGRMYDFDDAQPFNVRLMAMDMQVTMSNR
jgi:hypothetical protein